MPQAVLHIIIQLKRCCQHHVQGYHPLVVQRTSLCCVCCLELVLPGAAAQGVGSSCGDGCGAVCDMCIDSTA